MKKDYHLGLGVSGDHAALADSVQGFADQHLTQEVMRAAVEAPEQLPSFWPALARQGLLGLHVEEEYGGQGAGLLELAVALEVIGRTAAPRTVRPHGAGLRRPGGDQVQGGRGAASRSDRRHRPRRRRPHRTADRPRRRYGRGHRRGHRAAAGRSARRRARRAGGRRRRPGLAVDAAQVPISGLSAVDVVRGVALATFDGVTVAAHRILDELTTDQVEAIATVVLGAEAIGVASRCVSMAAEYAQGRVQFGRPIGQFQGVKHRCAQAGVALELARAAVWDAARAIDAHHEDSGYAVAVARLVAADAAVSTARDCMQVLGGTALVLRGVTSRGVVNYAGTQFVGVLAEVCSNLMRRLTQRAIPLFDRETERSRRRETYERLPADDS